MSMNRVQFQKGLTMDEFDKQFGMEQQCHDALVAYRWPAGFVCPCCGETNHSTFLHEGRQYWQCGNRKCRHQTTVRAGTLYQASKLSLRQWFRAAYEVSQSKNNVSALSLMRRIGVSYKTAWLLVKKLTAAMQAREDQRVLKDTVQIDDAYLGGEHPGTRGRGSENKVPFIAAVQTTPDGKPVLACFTLMPFTKEGVMAWAKKTLAAGTEVWSDGLSCFRSVTAAGATHSPVVMSELTGRQAAQHPKFLAVNTVLGNLKTAFAGTYHAFDFKKYGAFYLAAVQYRFNRRFTLAKITHCLIRDTVRTGQWTEKRFRTAEACN